MYDQTVRNNGGGQMGKYLQQDKMVNEQYVIDRIGYFGHSGINITLPILHDSNKINQLILFSKKILGYAKRGIINVFLGEKNRLGKFRLGGEPHLWMYDKYSLSRLLKDVGFNDIKIKTVFESDIPNWNLYELELKNGLTYCTQNGLFIEARK
jgi:hypothetical protein